VLVASGAIGANFLAHFALVEPGDTVVCATPTYQQLYSVPEVLGAHVKLLPLRLVNDYLPDVDELRALVDDRTRLIVINNPNNPTGALIDQATLGDIVRVAEECGAFVHCDEVYRHLEHEEGATAPSIVDLYELGIGTGSMSKAFSLAGLRTGWVVGSPQVIARCLACRDYTTISCGVVDDILATVALARRDKVVARARAIVRGNAATLAEWVRREPRVSYVPPRAGTVALVHYDYDVPAEEFCQALFDLNGTFVTPGSCFGIEHCFRIGYASAVDVLVAGLAGISEYLRTLEG
jgi:aspartate/methionine/tyrosine aminotransferase